MVHGSRMAGQHLGAKRGLMGLVRVGGTEDYAEAEKTRQGADFGPCWDCLTDVERQPGPGGWIFEFLSRYRAGRRVP